ncbi:ATP-dependent RNA helicase DbpA [Pseudoalteromonas sp. SMS1]|uniref:ATP-dependent RNA helicase DbpA n=1 Tax=Pseudoalteromonas sp. SMS1 TaxID=2908894 RepID=UPI001F2ACAFB|nr:ATP-dependent RNA helicase DbpA [Pseudoalteromonas sp. SMS1]MCF2858581.1 ATP-dependent RNA helicase DbpA [Pseudoalteromonas sp. SMS1]
MNPLFTQLSLRAELHLALSKAGFSRMTPIQSESLPELLAGKDVVAQAKTGSGKTLAFSLAMLQNLVLSAQHIQGLILAPTRELANQVAEEVRKLARELGNVKVLTICGGEAIGPQMSSLEHGAHIVVGTPGRVEEHLFKGTLDLTQVTHFILDEADQMLDMGFVDAIENIAVYLPPTRQTMMFSATYPKDIEQLSARFMQSPMLVKGETESLNRQIKQQFFPLKNNKLRFNTLRLLLLQHKPQSCIVFCNTKVETKKLFLELQQTGLQVAVLHGDLAQIERQRMLLRFANKSASILVATDVAARGLDIEDIDMVVNYHMALDPQTHVHRVGRTGRGGKKGFACSLYGENETFKVTQLSELYEREFNPSPTPPLSLLDKPAYKPTMVTVMIDAGKKQKVRAGDIVGCLTGENGIGSAQIGNITVQDNQAYIAIFREAVKPAMRKLNAEKIKGKRIKAKRLV